MASPIAVAFVEVVPDTRAFAPLLQTRVNAAIRSISVAPITVPVAVAGGPGGVGALAAESSALSAAQLGVAESAGVAAASERAYATALQAGGVDLAAFATANQVAAAAELEVAGAAKVSSAAVTGVGAKKATEGLFQTATAGNAAKGALIGLSRITPVAVFGLGLAGTAAIGAGLAIKSAITSAANFEEQLNILQATTGATAAQMAEISRVARQLGADVSLPATSAADAAVGLTELAKAGLSIQDSLAAARGVLELAAAAGIDVGTAAQFAATELNAFRLQGSQATHVADVLANASIAAQGSISDMAIALEQSATAAQAVGLTLEQTTGLLTELAKAGLTGSDAGTSLRVALLRLVPTTKQAADFMDALGIKIDRTQSIGQQLNSILNQYQHQLALLLPTQRQAVLQQILGQDAFRAGNIIFSEGAAGLNKTVDALQKQGTAAKLSEARSRGLSGAIRGLQSNAETLGINLGSLVKGPLTSLVTVLSDTVTIANGASQAIQDFATAVGRIDFPGLQKLFGLFGTIEKDLHFPVVAGITALVASARKENQEFNKVIAETQRSKKDLSLAQGQGFFGVNTFLQPEKPVAGRDFGIGTRDASAEETRLRKRITDLAAKRRNKKILLDQEAPLALQNAQLNAQLNNSLQQELVADRKIESFFEARLKTANEGTKRFNTILGSLTSAHNATQSVLGQIKAQNDAATAAAVSAAKAAAAAAKEAAQKILDAFSLERNQAQLAIDKAEQTPGAADNVTAIDVLIAIIKRQIATGKLKGQDLVSVRGDLIALRAKEKTAIEEQVQSDIDFNRSVLDLALHKAQVLTPNDQSDDKAIIRKIIANDEKKLALYKKAGKAKRDLVIQVQTDIFDLKQLLNKGLDSGGFTLNDLFAEAARQLSDFGSNISQSPTTGGGARSALASGIVAQQPRDLAGVVASKADKQIEEATTTNDFLRQILDLMKANGVILPTQIDVVDPRAPGAAGFATAVHQRKFANAQVGGD